MPVWTLPSLAIPRQLGRTGGRWSVEVHPPDNSDARCSVLLESPTRGAIQGRIDEQLEPGRECSSDRPPSGSRSDRRVEASRPRPARLARKLIRLRAETRDFGSESRSSPRIVDAWVGPAAEMAANPTVRAGKGRTHLISRCLKRTTRSVPFAEDAIPGRVQPPSSNPCDRAVRSHSSSVAVVFPAKPGRTSDR